MIKYRLNKETIEKAMSEQFLTHAELARKLKWSRSLLAWALTKGSKSFAPKIAKVLGLDASEIIVVQPNERGPAGAGAGNREQGSPGRVLQKRG